MRKAIYLLFFLVWLCPAACMAQGLHFGLKAGVLGNKADIQGISNRVKTENMTGFQVGPMLQYQTGFYGLTLDFSLLYVQRGVKLTNTSNDVSADIKTQSIDIPIELKWEMGLSDNFDLFLGIGPSFSFLVNEDNWGRKLVHIAVDAIDKDLSSMGWRSTEVGLNLGGGVKIMKHLMLSCYYNIGLTESARHHIGGDKHDAIDKIFDGDIFKSRNRYWQLSLAYIF